MAGASGDIRDVSPTYETVEGLDEYDIESLREIVKEEMSDFYGKARVYETGVGDRFLATTEDDLRDAAVGVNAAEVFYDEDEGELKITAAGNIPAEHLARTVENALE